MFCFKTSFLNIPVLDRKRANINIIPTLLAKFLSKIINNFAPYLKVFINCYYNIFYFK
jgi:hypothetical protein